MGDEKLALKEEISKILSSIRGNVGIAVKDLNTGETTKINEDRVFPSASTIKLVIMSEVLRQVKEGLHDPDETVVLTDDMKTGGDGILKELNAGHGFTLKEIITLMIILSDNTATNILIDMAGMDNVNALAGQLGLRHTKLQRKMMDSAAARAGRDNFTAAEDMCRILELIRDGKNIDREYSDIMLEILKKQQVRGRLDLYLPEDVPIAHKTGDLDYLEHDVGIVYLPNGEYIICVLTNEMESNKEAREVIGKISRVVYEKMKEPS